MAGNSKSLFITVGGTVNPLKDTFREGKSALAQFQGDVLKTVDAANADLRKLLADPNTGKQMEAGLKAQIAGMQRAANEAIRAATNAPGGLDAIGRMTATGAAAAADALEKLAAAERDTLAALEATSAGSARQAAQLETNIVAARANAAALEQNVGVYRDLAAVAPTASEEIVKIGGMSGQSRQSVMILGEQVRQFGTEVALGISPVQAFTQQIGQATYALQLMGGEGNAFVRFIGGPWGIAVLTGVSVLMALIPQMKIFSDEVGDATKKLEEEAHSTDIARQAQEAYDRTLEGSIEKERKLVEELEKRIKSQRELNAEQLAQQQKALKDAQDRLPGAKRAVADARSALDDLRTHPPASMGMDRGGAGALAAWELQIGKAEDRLRSARKELSDLQNQGIPQAQAGVRAAETVIARAALPGQADPKAAQREAIQVKIDNAFDEYAAGKISAAVRDSITIPAQKQLDALGKSRERSAGAGGENALGQMVALLPHLLPGAIVAHTTDGKHVAGSDHYAGRAIDFVLPGRMKPSDFNGVLEDLEAGGVKIRRNARGTLQFFGPGHGPNGPGDHSHDNHYHVAFDGTPSIEAADKTAAERATRQRHDDEAYADRLSQAEIEKAQLARDGVTDAQQLADLDKAAIDTAMKKKAADNAKFAIDHDRTGMELLLLDLADQQVADARKAAIDRKTRQAVADKDLRAEEDQLQLQGQLLEIQGQLAPTLRERLRIALQILENERQQALNRAARQQNDHPSDDYAATVAGINQRYDAQRAVIEKQNQGPLGQYRDQLKSDVGDINAALQGLEVTGLQDFSNELLAVADGTEKPAAAVKKMVASILADLARLAIEKAILTAIGLKTGDVPAAATGMVPGFADGLIVGPGTGTSDSIFAWHEQKGLIRVSNGESIVTAEGTRKYGRQLRDINAGRVPSFADGLVASTAYPAIPSAAALRQPGGNGPPLYFDLRGAVMTEDLLRQMNAISARHAMVAVASGPSLAMQELREQQATQIPT